MSISSIGSTFLQGEISKAGQNLKDARSRKVAFQTA